MCTGFVYVVPLLIPGVEPSRVYLMEAPLSGVGNENIRIGAVVIISRVAHYYIIIPGSYAGKFLRDKIIPVIIKISDRIYINKIKMLVHKKRHVS